MGKFDKVKDFNPNVRVERRAQQVDNERCEWASASPQRKAVIEARWLLRDTEPEPGFYLYGDGSSLVEVYSKSPGELDDREVNQQLQLGQFWMPLLLETLIPALQRLPNGVPFPIALAFESGCIDTFVRVELQDVGMVDLGLFPQTPGVWLKAAQTAVPVVWYTPEGSLKSDTVTDRAQVGYQRKQFVFLEMKGKGKQKTWKPMDDSMSVEMVHVPSIDVGGTGMMSPLPGVLSFAGGPLWSPALFPPTPASASASFSAPLSGPLLPSPSWPANGVTSGPAGCVPSWLAGGVVTLDTPPNSREVTASNSPLKASFLPPLNSSTSASLSTPPPRANDFSAQPSFCAPAPAPALAPAPVGPISNDPWANYAPAHSLGSWASAEVSLPADSDYAMSDEDLKAFVNEFLAFSEETENEPGME
ncbi:hypothetical protein BKA63DRAFT_115999 [Paraphoma chrysanthemicola]|nr:hypothetical protein BKA63DRAFT_115999 [Paraphoma chrysanthemicola]